MQIDADVDESRSVLRYMRRCCLCFVCSCCCDGDKDVVRDNTRAKRVKECARAPAGALPAAVGRLCIQFALSLGNPAALAAAERVRNGPEVGVDGSVAWPRFCMQDHVRAQCEKGKSPN